MLKNEKGTALLMALIMLLLLTLIGFAAITTSSVEVQISGNQRVGTTAMYAFEAGIESIRQEYNNSVVTDSNGDSVLTNLSSSNPSYGMYSGIESYPNKGVSGKGNLWGKYNPGESGKVSVVSGTTEKCPDMFVFLVEGTSGFARKSVEVGIIPRETKECPDPSGTGYEGGKT